ncbi:glycoside hydrolase family 27 protein [Verrucomicrobiaceae bacterium N1E253]|uniref:Alpha-galactosidase n=1 Tax=Oceaniferula marina TaxID=2748318 RepID=A0A851GLJ0_9BACT|nr:glycoside hydrolase family 27 protein [Oceaniferula marina]NWK55630.1 glycoside hydrolase family 27 protein [Oceaniferula marina]
MRLLNKMLGTVLIGSVSVSLANSVESVSENSKKAFHAWASTPPMGWNSWDCYGPTVTEDEVKANADYMAKHLKDTGWEYIVVDIRWYVENTKAGGYNRNNPQYVMDQYGRLQPATNRFPSSAGGKGFKPLADYVHSKGLKFGIHLMRGIPIAAVKKNTPILGSTAKAADVHSQEKMCRWLKDMYKVEAGREGSQEYYDSIFKMYAEWGVDYVKVDDLSFPYHKDEIEMIRKAIDKTGRRIVFSTSPGKSPLSEAEHLKGHANLWRMSGDLWDNWKSVEHSFALCRSWSKHVGTGHWPDADMLPLGRLSIRGERGRDRMSKLSKDEQITLMTLWSIFRSPLMFGGDLPSNDEFTLSLLNNKEVMAVNQASTGNREILNKDGLSIWVADVPHSKEKYVALFNVHSPNGEKPVNMTLNFKDIGLVGTCKVRDLWTSKDLGDAEESYSVIVPKHGSKLYKVTPKE